MGMGFAQVASRLVQNQLQPTGPGSAVGNAGHLQNNKEGQLAELNAAGFSRREVLTELKELANECTEEEKSIKYNILKTAAQMHGMLVPEEQARAAPVIQLTVVGDNARITAMLCPNIEVNGG